MNRHADAVVCGAGAAGLAAATTLGRAGLSVTVLERTDEVGASWRTRYDGLRLNTPGWMSTLPGYRASRRRYGEFPTRDDWVRYLEDYAKHHRIRIRFGTQARKVTATDNGWRIETNGDDLDARFVVVATGHDLEPQVPGLPGIDGYTGELIHSSAYHNPDPYRGRDVPVVGPNTTGSEIANYLAKGGARRVQLSCRTPPNLTARKFLGLSVNVPGVALNHVPLRIADRVAWLTQWAMFGKLDRYGLARSPHGIATNLARRQHGPAYDDGFVVLQRLSNGSERSIAHDAFRSAADRRSRQRGTGPLDHQYRSVTRSVRSATRRCLHRSREEIDHEQSEGSRRPQPGGGQTPSDVGIR